MHSCCTTRLLTRGMVYKGMSDFREGRQPCDNYDPELEGEGWANVHECFCKDAKGEYCSGSVSWCINCSKDHHKGGYETCTCRKHQKEEATK